MDFLEKWNPSNLLLHKNFVISLIGQKRCGKSVMLQHLLKFVSKHTNFDLVISFSGTRLCCPEIHSILEESFDPRFMFSKFNSRFLLTLLDQQEQLISQGKTRKVLLLFDDCDIENNEDRNTLGYLATRHRHFHISMISNAVRYSYIHKSYRSATDVLFLFTIPMYSDRKMLLLEHAENRQLAGFAMRNLKPYESLVIQSGFKQKLFSYRCTYGENLNEVCEIETSEPPENPNGATQDQMKTPVLNNEDSKLEFDSSQIVSSIDEFEQEDRVL